MLLGYLNHNVNIVDFEEMNNGQTWLAWLEQMRVSKQDMYDFTHNAPFVLIVPCVDKCLK